MLGFETKNINLNFRFYRLTSVEKFALVYNFIMNSTHKHYSINNSRVAPASSHSFQNEQQLQYLDKYKQKHESSGSQKEEDQRFADKKPRISRISERNMNIGSSVAFSKHMTTIQQKRKKLQKYKYINQLARMEYEDKLEQVYTKYTRQSKITATKKILAKNQIAEFIEEQQDENIGYDELLEFQYGKNKGQSFHFQKQQILDYDFCLFCDCIHNDHSQVHSVICERKRKEQPQLYSPYSDRYPKECLIRIKNASEKIKSREFQQLYTLISKLEKFSHQSPSILNRQKANIISSIKQLKQTYKSQDLFSKVIKKAHNILAKL